MDYEKQCHEAHLTGRLLPAVSGRRRRIWTVQASRGGLRSSKSKRVAPGLEIRPPPICGCTTGRGSGPSECKVDIRLKAIGTGRLLKMRSGWRQTGATDTDACACKSESTVRPRKCWRSRVPERGRWLPAAGIHP